MKKFLLIILLLLVGTIIWLATTFSAEVIAVGKPPQFNLPANTSPPTMLMTAFNTGSMSSKAGFAFRGGDLGEERTFAMGTVLIRHPSGNLLIDTGFASNVDQHFKTTPAIMQRTANIEPGQPLVKQLPTLGLSASDITAVILTHAHWDHVSGMADLPDVPVWVTSQELEFTNSESEHTAVARLIGTDHYQTYDFPDKPYLGFDSSYDVFGDKSVVLVPASGHSPGSIIAFVTLPDDRRYAFIGDLAWQKEGVDIPAEKPWLSRTLIGEDSKSVRRLLVHVHHLQKQINNLTVVPAHDQRVWASLPGTR